MRILAWLYLRLPLWLARALVPKSLSETVEGRFFEAVTASYDRSLVRGRRKIYRHSGIR